jgi:catechol 2,3-dioxygenase-like lactoylglutathione lyase family enzyme
VIPLASIDHVQITVAPEDVEATLAFYEKVMGLKRIPKSNDRPGGWFELGPNQLHVGVEGPAAGGTSQTRTVERTSRELNLASKRHVCFRVTDLAAAERTLREQGVAIVPDPDPAPNWKRFYVRDPGGNRVEIATPG